MSAQRAAVDAVAKAADQAAGRARDLRDGADRVEALHELRVALRRVRSLLRVYGRSFDDGWVAAVIAEYRALSEPFGAARDLDVLIARLDAHGARLDEVDQPAFAKLRKQLATERERAHQLVRDSVSGDRWSAFEMLLASPITIGTLSEAEIATELAGRWRKLQKQGRRRRLEGAPDEALHELRIRIKRLRYSLDAASLVLGPDAAAHARALGAVQDHLGVLHDTVVSQAQLRRRAAADPRLAFVAGQLAGFERAAYERARARWRKQWRRARRSKLLGWAAAA